jgi:hypothetical protein
LDSGDKTYTDVTAKSTLRIRVCLPPRAINVFYNDETNQLLKPLKGTGGFLLPIQPQISLGFDAKYQEVTPTHSNFPYQLYQSSSMKPISLTAEFIIRNEKDAQYVNAGIHFLKSLTRMFNSQDGNYAGAPPQVARIKGMGFSGFDNVPVVLTDLTVNYPDSVDFISFRVYDGSAEIAKIPVTLTISMNFSPIFSRDYITNTYSTTNFSKGIVRLFGPNEFQQSDDQWRKNQSEAQTNVQSSPDLSSTPPAVSKPGSSGGALGDAATTASTKSNILSKALALGGKLGSKVGEAAGSTTLQNLTNVGIGVVSSTISGGNPLLGAVTGGVTGALLGQQPGIVKSATSAGINVVGKFLSSKG